MKIKKALFIVIMTLIIFQFNIKSFAAETLSSIGSVIVNCQNLNLRGGPGLDYPIVCRLHRGEKLNIYFEVGEWLLVKNKNNFVGMVRQDYVTSNTMNSKTASNLASSRSINQQQEKELLNLINKERSSSGIRLLKIDTNLTKISSLKAFDMVNTNYFSHSSPTYGSPFDMMKHYKVKFKTAGENIAGNTSVKAAFNAWIKSAAQRKNILNKNFNYTGISIVNSANYGKIIVQEFVGR